MPFQIVRNDITKMKADVIVNTANPDPVCGSGTDAAIYKAAGPKLLLAERNKIGKINVGQAAITPAFHLDAKYIIHTVGPVWRSGWRGESRSLRACYDNSLDLALEHHCKSIAFPLISTGTYKFPREKALQIALTSINEFLAKHEMLIYLTVFDQQSFRLSGRRFRDIDSFIDDNYVRYQMEREYQTASFQPLLSERIPRACAPARTERSLDDIINNVGETFQERLLRFIDERNLTNAQVYKRANLSRKLFSKILCNPDYQPKKRTVIAFAIALQLNLDDAKDLMARAGFALSPGSRFDLVIEYFIERQIYDIYTINMALFDHGLPLLGE